MEFGAGISAVVGPNGSGKSNLADALRWALGEQGRALRSRKAEDVIWAGSEKRAAQGMADVTLVLDNADGLLPVDFQVLELGRRCSAQRRERVPAEQAADPAARPGRPAGRGAPRRQRVPVHRPGHGRPGARAPSEERRPFFEEVAGVRRHERRRRKPRSSWSSPRRTWRGSRTSSPSSAAGPPAGGPGRAAGDARVDAEELATRCCSPPTRAGTRRRRGSPRPLAARRPRPRRGRRAMAAAGRGRDCGIRVVERSWRRGRPSSAIGGRHTRRRGPRSPPCTTRCAPGVRPRGPRTRSRAAPRRTRGGRSGGRGAPPGDARCRP